jgi:hypothetical protein
MSFVDYYSASWTGTTIVCAPTPTSTTTSTTTAAKIGTVQWDGCIRAITAVLDSLNVTVSSVSMSTATTSRTGTGTTTTGTTDVTGADVLRALLTTARTVGVAGTTSVGIESLHATPYTALQLQYTDIAVTGVQASGSFSVSHISEKYVNVNRASFVIFPPSVKARSIVIVITVGGVKVTIIVRW